MPRRRAARRYRAENRGRPGQSPPPPRQRRCPCGGYYKWLPFAMQAISTRNRGRLVVQASRLPGERSGTPAQTTQAGRLHHNSTLPLACEPGVGSGGRVVRVKATSSRSVATSRWPSAASRLPPVAPFGPSSMTFFNSPVCLVELVDLVARGQVDAIAGQDAASEAGAGVRLGPHVPDLPAVLAVQGDPVDPAARGDQLLARDAQQMDRVVHLGAGLPEDLAGRRVEGEDPTAVGRRDQQRAAVVEARVEVAAGVRLRPSQIAGPRPRVKADPLDLAVVGRQGRDRAEVRVVVERVAAERQQVVGAFGAACPGRASRRPRRIAASTAGRSRRRNRRRGPAAGCRCAAWPRRRGRRRSPASPRTPSRPGRSPPSTRVVPERSGRDTRDSCRRRGAFRRGAGS